MKRLLTSTTALSLAFAPLSPLPLAAQVAVDTSEGTAFCLAAPADPCPEGEVCFVAETGDCAAPGIEAEAAQALMETAGDAPATAGTDAPVQAPDAAAEQSATTAPTAEAETAGAPEAASDAPAASAGADAPAEEAPASAAPAAAPAESPAAPTTAAPETAAADEPVPPQATGEAAPVAAESTGEVAAKPTAEVAAKPTGEVAAKPTAEVAAEDEAAPQDPVAEPPEAVENAATGVPPETAPPETAPPLAVTPDVSTAQAEEAPAQIIGEAAAVLQDILGAGSDDAEGDAPTAAAAAAAATDNPESDPAPAADVTETDITEDNSRASSEDFAAAPTATAGAERRKGLSDLERFGLVALGALAVGAILKNGDQVVSNTGDRVVVEDDRGEFRVLKDDDTLLRRPGSRLRTETFNDGSTRSTLAREDGSSIVTIRDASGRVLRRARYAPDGSELVLIDDLQQFDRIDVATLPPPPAPRDQIVISAAQSPDDLALALAAIEARENARAYSLRQIREYREVRALAPTIDVESITFRSGSSAIDVTEAEKLSALGRLIAGVLETRPYEIFLVEGHTDAVGSASSNLALSDRRAESVALALTEYFGIPPENLVVQGYGEAELRIPTQAAEERNRRAAVRLISPLLRTAASR